MKRFCVFFLLFRECGREWEILVKLATKCVADSRKRQGSSSSLRSDRSRRSRSGCTIVAFAAAAINCRSGTAVAVAGAAPPVARRRRRRRREDGSRQSGGD